MKLRQPSSSVTLILPWNASLVAFMMKIGAALAARNTMVTNSSAKAPLLESCFWREGRGVADIASA